MSTNIALGASMSLSQQLQSDDMSLDDKLAAIDAAMANATQLQQTTSSQSISAPVDPADLTMCLGCQ